MTTPETEGGESVEEHEYPYESEPGKTHWKDCWKAPGHHNCAVARVYRLRRALMAYEGALQCAENALSFLDDDQPGMARASLKDLQRALRDAAQEKNNE